MSEGQQRLIFVPTLINVYIHCLRFIVLLAWLTLTQLQMAIQDELV